MAQIISIVNQKGGVAKTTTAGALIAGLYNRGYKVLGIDLDSQCNLSNTMRATGNKSILGVLAGELSIDEAIQYTIQGDIVQGHKALMQADSFINETGKEYKLKEAIEQVKNKYDYIIIDNPPALSILTINSLTASNKVIITAIADLFSMQGIEQLNNTIEAVKKYCNNSLYIAGILLVKHNPKLILNQDILQMMLDIAEQLKTKVFNTTIREAIAIREAQIKKQDIFSYAPNSKVADDYNKFIDELIQDK